jgi:hypothetical protein
LIPLIEGVPPICGKCGRPRQRPGLVCVGRGYHQDTYRRQISDLSITPVVARRGTDHHSGLGALRWVVEAAFALLRVRSATHRLGDPRRHLRGVPRLGCAIVR